MTKAELRIELADALNEVFFQSRYRARTLAPAMNSAEAEEFAIAAIAIVGEACAEIAADYDWLGERRAAGIGRTGSGVDEGTYAVACDHAATEIAQHILALTQKTPDD